MTKKEKKEILELLKDIIQETRQEPHVGNQLELYKLCKVIEKRLRKM